MSAEKSIGAIAVAGLAVLCCAGPLLLATIGSVAISASALTGSLAIVAGVAGIWMVGDGVDDAPAMARADLGNRNGRDRLGRGDRDRRRRADDR